MANQTKTIIIKFYNQIAHWEIPLFRGCVINSMEHANLLFHNHESEDKLRYSYPLIQYKTIQGKAAIVCIGKGNEAIGDFFNSKNLLFNIGNRSISMEIDHIASQHTKIEVIDDEITYTINKWMPFNSDNYNIFNSTDDPKTKKTLLEKILVGNMLSCCKGLDITIVNTISCQIIDIENQSLYLHKGKKKLGFDVKFKSNLLIPDYIGLGKGVSLGYGTTKQLFEL